MHKRIIILGGSGSGKSTLASRISVFTGYELFHLDNLFLKNSWHKKDKDQMLKISEVFLSKDSAIVEGNYTDTLDIRIKWADLIIFIDTTTFIQIYRVLCRYIKIILNLEKRYGKPEESKEALKWNFLLWVYDWNSQSKPKINEMLKNHADKKVVYVKNTKSVILSDILNN